MGKKMAAKFDLDRLEQLFGPSFRDVVLRLQL
jgi:hypothetical protein